MAPCLPQACLTGGRQRRSRRLHRSPRNSFCSMPSELSQVHLLGSKCCQRHTTALDLDSPSSSTSNHRRKLPTAAGISPTHSKSSVDHALPKPSPADIAEQTALADKQYDGAQHDELTRSNNHDVSSNRSRIMYQSSQPENIDQLSLTSSNHLRHHSPPKYKHLQNISSSVNNVRSPDRGYYKQGTAPSVPVSKQQYPSASEELPATKLFPAFGDFYAGSPIRLSATGRHRRLPSSAERHQVLSALINHPLHLFSYRGRKLPFHLRNRHRVASNIQDRLRALSSKHHHWSERDDVTLDLSASEHRHSAVRLPAPHMAVAMGREALARRLAHGRLPASLDKLRIFQRIQGISLSLTDDQRN